MAINKLINNHSLKDINNLIFIYQDNSDISIDLINELITNPDKQVLRVNDYYSEISKDKTTIDIILEKDKNQLPDKDLWSMIIFCKDDLPLSYILYQVSNNEIDTSEIKKLVINYKLINNKSENTVLYIDYRFYLHLEETLKLENENKIHSYLVRYKNDLDTIPITSNFIDDNTYQLYNNKLGDSSTIVSSHSRNKCGDYDYTDNYVYQNKINSSFLKIDDKQYENTTLCGSSTYGMSVIYKDDIYPLNNISEYYSFTRLKDTNYQYMLVEGIILVAYNQNEIYISTLIEDENKFTEFSLAFKTDKRIYIPSFYDLCPVAMLDDGTFISLPNNIDDEDYELHDYNHFANVTYSDLFYTNNYNVYKISSKEDLSIMMSYFNPSIDVGRYWDNLLAMRELYNTLRIMPKYRNDKYLDCKFYDCGLVLDGVFIPYSLALSYNTRYTIINSEDVVMNLSIIKRINRDTSVLISMLTGNVVNTNNDYVILDGKYGYLLYGNRLISSDSSSDKEKGEL